MSATALATLEANGAPDVLVDYARFVAGLNIGPEAKRHRRNAACELLNAHPDLKAWMARPTRARLADLARSHAWSFITWCFLEQILVPDLDLLLTKTPGDLYSEWGQRHADDVARVSEIARRYSWSANWTRDVATQRVGDAVPVVGEGSRRADRRRLRRLHRRARRHPLGPARRPSAQPGPSLQPPPGLLRAADLPPHPRKNRPPAATVAETLQALPQPEIRQVALRYLEVVATTLRPSTVLLRADSLIIFGEYLAAHHPDLRRLEQLERAHIEGFLVWNHHRPWRGWLARDKPVAASVSKRTVVDLRAFFEDLAVWGWADRPTRQLVFASDIPRLDRPMPKALPPDVDRDLMAAVAGLADPFARHGLAILRGTGMRLGELLDLELDCLWDFGDRGTWVKVPLGKLGTERTVPLDDPTLADFDAWMAQRGPQRALIHPRHGQPADFLFVERGRRLSAFRLRHGLDQAIAIAGLTGRDGQALRVTPHQLRHTYGTSLVNAGMSLQALMALMGHVSAEMTLRYASLASPTVRAAYEAAMTKVHARQALFVVATGRGTAPDRVEWLRSEMLKTRVAHGYCSRDLVAEACPYANICEQCDNYVAAPEFQPVLEAQLADIHTLRDDAQARGWDSEVARHERVIASIDGHLRRLKNQA